MSKTSKIKEKTKPETNEKPDRYGSQEILEDLEGLDEKIREIRKAKGKTQKEFSKETGIGRTTLGLIETSKQRPTFQFLRRMWAVYKVDVYEFLEIPDPNSIESLLASQSSVVVEGKEEDMNYTSCGKCLEYKYVLEGKDRRIAEMERRFKEQADEREAFLMTEEKIITHLEEILEKQNEMIALYEKRESEQADQIKTFKELVKKLINE